MTEQLVHRVEQFLYREARLQDEHRYEDWESLWDDDAIYWIPANSDDSDPATQMSIAYDNRSRISTRVRQFLTGKRHAQAPPSRLRRVISNVELLDASELDEEELPDDLIAVAANFVLFESRRGSTKTWAGNTRYRLRDHGDHLRLVHKHIYLIDNDQALSNLAFLL